MALGAGRRRIAWMVLRDALTLVVIGLAAGLPGVIVVGRLLRHTLFNLSPVDPTTGLFAFSVMLLFAALASWIPALHAARIDPITALRDE